SWHHAVSRRLDRAVLVAGVDSVLGVVFPETLCDDRVVDLDSRHGPPAAHRSTHEPRLEIHAADGAAEHRRRRSLALHRIRELECRVALAGVRRAAGGALHPLWPRPGYQGRQTSLPLCRLTKS